VAGVVEVTTFESWVRVEHEPLLRFAGTLVRDHHQSQDLVQDVLVKAHEHWPRIAGTDYPRAYVRRMLANEAVSSWRRAGRVEVVPDRVLDRAAPDQTPTVDLRDALLRAMACLPARQRTVLVLRYLRDAGDDDIAAALGCSPVTVRVLAHRALRTLRAAHGDELRNG
jgi:RNA polymerase sigma-70 factor (sigma-E family)